MPSESPLPFLYPDQSEFILLRCRSGLYIDKTHHVLSLLAPTNRDPSLLNNKYVLLARHRRFGKSLLVTTLEASFQGEVPSDPRYLNGHNPEPILCKAELFRGTAAADTVESRGAIRSYD